MRDGRDVVDGADFQADGLEGADGGFTAEPGPLTRISTSLMPCDMAWRAASWATICAA